MNEQMKKIAQALSINKENAGLWIQLILCILAILIICRRSLFSVSVNSKSSKKK